MTELRELAKKLLNDGTVQVVMGYEEDRAALVRLLLRARLRPISSSSMRAARTTSQRISILGART